MYTVYFLQKISGGPIKIGKTKKSAAKRLEQIGNMNPEGPSAFRILGTTTKLEESFLHGKFAHLNLHSEWFKEDPQIYNYIKKFCLDYDNTIEVGRLQRKSKKSISRKVSTT